MRRAIVTGATGVIGTALVQELIDNNIEVLVFCRKDSARNVQIPSHPFVTLKYCSLDQLTDLVNDTGKEYDVFYHFAWEGTTGTSRNDMFLQNQNVKYALDAVNCAKRFGCKKFIGAGSQAEYGRFEGKLKSDTPTFPEMGYGMAKLCAGQMTREHAHQLGMEHNWVRILSVYGPNDGENSLISYLFRSLEHGESPKLTKGEQVWDYLYSSDAAKAFRLLGEKGKDRKVYVLGSGNGRLLRDYVKEMRDIVASNVELDFGGVEYGEKQVMYLVADISDMEKDIGWKPEVLWRDGIKSLISL